MKQLIASAFFALTLAASAAHATYVQADLTTPSSSLPTHVVIAGQGLEDGTSWLAAAHTEALVYRDRDPESPIRLIAAVDPANKDKYLNLLRSWGYKNIVYHPEDMTGDQVVARLSEVPMIASLDFDGHDGAFLGLALQDEGSNHRFYTENVDKMVGKVRFSKDAFIRLMGCNTGWFLAPYMAKKLGVPAAGTLTSSDVEIMASNGNWYYDEDGRRPQNTSWASTNQTTYEKPVACIDRGGCIRLKAGNHSYYGQHGVYAGALPFTKFFCGSDEHSDCFRRMALATRYVVSVTGMERQSLSNSVPALKDFAATLADQFCPPAIEPSSEACRNAVSDHVMGIHALAPTYTTLAGHSDQLTCDMSGCQFKVTRDSVGQKVLVATNTNGSTAFVDELNAYVAGYRTLEAQR